MRLPREARWIIGLTLAMGLLAWLLSAGEMSPDQRPTFIPSTYSSASFGMRALYLALEDLHYETQRVRHPLDKNLPARGSLLIIQPLRPLDASEWKALEGWVRRGHTLLVAADSGLPGIIAASPDFRSFLRIPTSYLRPAQPVQLARGVARLAIKSDAHVVFTSSGSEEPTHAPLPDQMAASPPELRRLLGQGVPVFVDQDRPVVTYTKLDRGEVIFLSSPWSLTNEGISKGDNIAFALNALGPPARGPVYFDEYHHGFGESTLARILPWPVKVAAVQVLLGILVGMYARSRRFGRIRPLLRESRERSDFLTTMAAVLRRGEATRLAVRTARDGLVHRLSRQLGLPLGATSAEVARAAARVSAEAGEKLGDALSRCDALLQARGELPQQQALALIGALDEAERTLRRL